MPASYGYVRVSSRDQNEDRQIIAMNDAGITGKFIFIDKQSGKDFDRPEYQRLRRKLKKGDTLFIKSIDSLGRNYNEILQQWQEIIKDIGADIVVLDMPLLDTQQRKDLMGTLIADIVLQLLSYVEQTERDFIKQRQAEEIAAAKARGVQFGLIPSIRPSEYQEYAERWSRGEVSARQAGKALGIAHTTFLDWLKKDGKK